MGNYKLHIIEEVPEQIISLFCQMMVNMRYGSLGCNLRDPEAGLTIRTMYRTPSVVIGSWSWLDDATDRCIIEIHDLLYRGLDPVIIDTDLIDNIMGVLDTAKPFSLCDPTYKKIGYSHLIYPKQIKDFLFDYVGSKMIPISWPE